MSVLCSYFCFVLVFCYVCACMRLSFLCCLVLCVNVLPSLISWLAIPLQTLVVVAAAASSEVVALRTTLPTQGAAGEARATSTLHTP